MGTMRCTREQRMQERRDTKRIDLTASITLQVEDLEVMAQMVNYSDDGALFRIETSDHDKIATDILGKDATFVLKLKDNPGREYTGEVIRFFFKGEDKYIALRFWEPYREIL